MAQKTLAIFLAVFVVTSVASSAHPSCDADDGKCPAGADQALADATSLLQSSSLVKKTVEIHKVEQKEVKEESGPDECPAACASFKQQADEVYEEWGSRLSSRDRAQFACKPELWTKEQFGPLSVGACNSCEWCYGQGGQESPDEPRESPKRVLQRNRWNAEKGRYDQVDAIADAKQKQEIEKGNPGLGGLELQAKACLDKCRNDPVSQNACLNNCMAE